MTELLTASNITFALGILAMLFTVYNYFRTPQEDLEKKQAVVDKEIDSKASILAQKEIENKAVLLAQQVEWEKRANEKKFAELGVRIDSAMTLAQNHIHSVDVKVDDLTKTVNTLCTKVTELSTIINERIPRK